MQKRELIDRLETWLMLYGSNKQPLPFGRTGIEEMARQVAERDFARDLFRNVGELRSVTEIAGSPAEAQLSEAISLATVGDPTKLPEVEALLQKVHAALRKAVLP